MNFGFWVLINVPLSNPRLPLQEPLCEREAKLRLPPLTSCGIIPILINLHNHTEILSTEILVKNLVVRTSRKFSRAWTRAPHSPINQICNLPQQGAAAH